MNNAVQKWLVPQDMLGVKAIHDAIVNGTQYPANPDKNNSQSASGE